MLILVTGVPGAGKTLNSIKMLLDDSNFKDRPVYFFNIADCSVPNWQELDEEQAKRWNEVPTGSIVFMDEAYKIFPPDKVGAAVPPHIQLLAEHRHLGIDLVLVAQHPHMLHTFVRKMSGRHYHYERPFGLPISRRLEWQEVCNDPSDHFKRQTAVITQCKQDKSIYKFYHSAEVHTHKVRIPKKLILIVFFAICSFLGIYKVIHGFKSRAEPQAVPVEQSVTNHPTAQAETPEQLAQSFKARIPDAPWSAPAYDELTKPKSFPKSNCILRVNTGDCSCYSQQATFMSISKEACLMYVKYGYFDFTKADTSAQPSGGQALAPPDGRQASNPPVYPQ